MKKIILLVSVTILSITGFAQNEKYIGAMKKNITMIDSAYSKPDVFLSLANSFERIGAAEKNQWLPFYYAAYCRVNFGFMQKDPAGNDAIADKVSELINKADSLQPANSEISSVKSMIATLRLMVNPMQRFMEYGLISDEWLEKSKDQDSANPRPYLLKGQGLKFTPEQFGGGCKTAAEQLATAVEKFATFKPATDIHPHWGKGYAETLLKGCK